MPTQMGLDKVRQIIPYGLIPLRYFLHHPANVSDLSSLVPHRFRSKLGYDSFWGPFTCGGKDLSDPFLRPASACPE